MSEDSIYGWIAVGVFIAAVMCFKIGRTMRARRAGQQPYLPVSSNAGTHASSALHGTAAIPLQTLGSASHAVAGPLVTVPAPAVVAPANNYFITIHHGTTNNHAISSGAIGNVRAISAETLNTGPPTHTSHTNAAANLTAIHNAILNSGSASSGTTNHSLPSSRRNSDPTGTPPQRRTGAPPRPPTPPPSIWMVNSESDTATPGARRPSPPPAYRSVASRQCLVVDGDTGVQGYQAHVEDADNESDKAIGSSRQN